MDNLNLVDNWSFVGKLILQNSLMDNKILEGKHYWCKNQCLEDNNILLNMDWKNNLCFQRDNSILQVMVLLLIEKVSNSNLEDNLYLHHK